MNTRFLKSTLLLLAFSVFYSCSTETTSTDPNAGVVKDKDGKIIEGTYKQFWHNGNLASVMVFKNRQLNGPAIKYYEDGTIRSELNYKNGKLHGVQKKHYESGELYMEEMYVEGKRNGPVKKYRKSGMLMSEVEYKNGFVSANLKEYLTNGKLKTKYPKLLVKEENTLKRNGTFTVKFYLSDNSKKVKYYIGKLDEGQFMHDGLTEQSSVYDGVLTYSFNLQPGEYVIRDLDIIAKTATRLNNSYITTMHYQINIKRPY